MAFPIRLALLSIMTPIVYGGVSFNATSLNANTLIKLGKDFNNPLLQLLGVAFVNTERRISQQIKEQEMAFVDGISFGDNATFMDHVCKLLECSPWASWSVCPTVSGEFGMSTRKRQCGTNNTLCTYATAKNETQSKVCLPNFDLPSLYATCPDDYLTVEGIFCLKILDREQNYEAATEECNKDGGYLVNINSNAKSRAVHKLLQQFGLLTRSVWINGKRSGSGDYEASYGQKTDYENWADNEPSRGSSELCKVEEGGPRTWWDRECFNHYIAVCEIVMFN